MAAIAMDAGGDAGGMVSALEQNATDLEGELNWLAQLIDVRFKLYFNLEGAEPTAAPEPPDLSQSPSPYATLLRELECDFAERVALVLALAPHLRPQILDVFFTRNQTFDRRFSEFGGVRKDSDGEFWPTGETLAFIIGGTDLAARFRLQALFEPDHPFARRGMLRAATSGGDEPPMKARLALSEDALALFTRGEQRRPSFGAHFPAQLVETALDWSDLVLHPATRQGLGQIESWIAHGYTLMHDWRMSAKLRPGYRSLFYGPPGTGKTLIARAVAGEANVPFFTISGSDFVEMFVGVGASRVRDMFEQAKKNAPCIIFIDEIDAVGRHRGAGLGGGNDEREQTLNQLLVEMDGFEANEGVILIAATNRPDVLDPALMRPGRFDRQVVVSNPDIMGREQILKVHVRKVPLAPDVNLKTIARGTPGFSGADLMNLVNEAALTAARRNKRMVTQSEFEEAKDKVLMGAERRSMVMTEEEKMLTAYHEAGHAIVGLNVPSHDPIHKATIIPRGRALGMVQSLPEADRHSHTREWCVSKLAMMFGGREAEVQKFGAEKVTNGATGDIQQATNLARAMVMEWGMSEKLGRVRYRSNEQEVFLGHSVSQSTNISDETAKIIDEEVRRLIEQGEQSARSIITDNRDQFIAIAEALLEFETLTGDELSDLMSGKPPSRDAFDDTSPSHRGSAVPSAGNKKGGSQGKGEGAEGFEPQPQ